MATTVLNAYSIAYPAITNRLRASVYLQTSPQALIATIIDSVAGHPARIWSFPGLPRNNYGFSLDEIDADGNVVNNLALFDVVPGETEGQLVRDDEQIQVDHTTGFVSGTNNFVFDGTGGKPNYIGWNIVPSELTGRGILVRGLDYSWDIDTGTFALLQANDYFTANTYYNIHFDPIANEAADSYPTLNDFTIRLITESTILDSSDAGKKIIVDTGGIYVEITLPDISTVVDGRPFMFEVGITTGSCVKFIPYGANQINYRGRSTLYAVQNESLYVYKFTRSAGNYEWRVCNESGNFLTVGNIISSDLITADIICAHPLDGAVESVFNYARIYNEIVLNLPLSQVCNFDDWGTGDNNKKYSYANSADPANLNKFHFPNRQGLYECNSIVGTTVAGTYYQNQNKQHSHHMNGNKNGSSGGQGGIVVSNWTGQENINDINGVYMTIENEGGDQARPETIVVNKFVLI